MRKERRKEGEKESRTDEGDREDVGGSSEHGERREGFVEECREVRKRRREEGGRTVRERGRQ
jgi:hypothetical protein